MYLDVYSNLTRNPPFQKRIEWLLQQLALLERGRDPNRMEKAQEILREVAKMCDYNMGVMVPYFFPKYPADKPLTLMNRPFAYALFAFITGGYLAIRGSRQISKSTTFCARQLITKSILPRWKSLYLAPHPTQAKTYANRMDEMNRAMLTLRKPSKKIRDNLYFKDTDHGSTITIANVLTSVMHIHGMTADEILFDEYQHFDTEFEEEILAITHSRKLQVYIYAGTATTQDSPLEEKFEGGTASTWHLRAGNGAWLNMGDKDTLLSIVKPAGPTCPITGRILNVMDGLFVNKNQGAVQDMKFSFHVPRIIIPEFAYDAAKWQTIYMAFRRDEKSALRSIGGLPVDDGQREITKQDLEDICVLGDQRKLLKLARDNQYRFIISGSDWGGSDHQQVFRTKKSYSAHVIYGITHSRQVHILHMRRFAGMQYEEVSDTMTRIHNELGGYAWGSDEGAGQYYNMMLRHKVSQHRHLVFNLVGPNTPPMALKINGGFYNNFNLNKTEALSALFGGIKNKRILCYQWDQASDGLLDFLNSSRVQTETVHGRRYFKYLRKADKADDMMMAAMFGYTMVRLVLGERLINDPALYNSVQNRMRDNSYDSIGQYSGSPDTSLISQESDLQFFHSGGGPVDEEIFRM